METAIDDYLKKFTLTKSSRGVEARAHIEQLRDFLKVQKITHWRDCNRKLINQYILACSQNSPSNSPKRLSSESTQTPLASIRLFFDCLVEKKMIRDNPTRLTKRPKTQRPLPKVASVDVLHALLSLPPKTNFEVRDLAMCELFYSSGLRLSELAALNYRDIDLEAREVRVINGKGGKDRIVPLGKQAKKALQKWNKTRVNMLDLDKNAVFISQRGGRLTTRQITYRVKAFGTKLGFNINLHPHIFRHSMASHVLESCHDIRVVQELLGHKDISTTQIYTQLDFSYLTRVYDKAHPRAKRKNQNLINED